MEDRTKGHRRSIGASGSELNVCGSASVNLARLRPLSDAGAPFVRLSVLRRLVAFTRPLPTGA